MGWKRRVNSSDEEHLELVTVILCLMIQVTKWVTSALASCLVNMSDVVKYQLTGQQKKFKLQEGCYTAHF